MSVIRLQSDTHERLSQTWIQGNQTSPRENVCMMGVDCVRHVAGCLIVHRDERLMMGIEEGNNAGEAGASLDDVLSIPGKRWSPIFLRQPVFSYQNS